MRVRTLLNPFKCPQRFTSQDWNGLFPEFQGNLDVEIGFGTGSFIRHYAQANLERSIVGFEIRKKWVDFAQEKVNEQKITNAYLVWGNGHFGLEDMFQDQSIDRLFIFHPDPWEKHRHHKRRIISLEFLELAHKKLKPNHNLYLATDVPELWVDMLATIKTSEKFIQTSDDEFWTMHYQTRWKEMSLQHNRSLFYGTFQAKKIILE